MPKAPILARESFFYRLRDGTFRWLDWNIVNTSIGAMIEARPVGMFGEHSSSANVDPYESSFNTVRELSPEEFTRLTGHGGSQVLLDYHVGAS